MRSRPSITIVAHLKNDADPCKSAGIGLKTLGNATVDDASTKDVKSLFDDLCEEAHDAHEEEI